MSYQDNQTFLKHRQSSLTTTLTHSLTPLTDEVHSRRHCSCSRHLGLRYPLTLRGQAKYLQHQLWL